MSFQPNAADYQPIIFDALVAVLKEGRPFTTADQSRVLGDPPPHWNLNEHGRIDLLRKVFVILHADKKYSANFKKIQLEGEANAKLTTKLVDELAKLVPGDAASHLANVVHAENGGRRQQQAPDVGV